MSVSGHTIGFDIFIDLTEQIINLGSSSCSGSTGFGINDDGVWIDQSFLHARIDREEAAGRIAAWISNKPCLFDLLSVDFTKSIHCFSNVLGCFMLNAIPFLIDVDIFNTKVRTQIDDLYLT